MAEFIHGLRLCGLFYQEAIKPILSAHFPALEYTVALIGSGSEVLGYDTEMSSDHHWGPRLMLFLREGDMAQAEAIRETLSHQLPHSFYGYPTNFGEPLFGDGENGTQLLQATDTGPIHHRVEIQTIQHFFMNYIGFNLDDELTVADWLTFPEQYLLTITGGAVYHDGIGLERARQRFAYYPHDVWLYLMAVGWARLSEEEHLMPRAGYVGDELGSSIVGSRLVRDVMRLCFLMERQYAPYPKWFGTAFARLASGPELLPHLQKAQWAQTWGERESHLCAAYEILAHKHNALKLTEPLPTEVSSFHGRPFRVIHGWQFSETLAARIADPNVKRLTAIGSLDLFSDYTERAFPDLRHQFRALYE